MKTYLQASPLVLLLPVVLACLKPTPESVSQALRVSSHGSEAEICAF